MKPSERWEKWLRRKGRPKGMLRPPVKKECVPEPFVRICRVDKIANITDGKACQGEDCPRCAKGYDGQSTSGNTAKRRAHLAMGRIMDGAGNRNLLQTVFTTPPEARAAFYRDPSLFYDACKRMVRYMAREWGLEGAAWTVHPTGEDLEDFAPHLHMLWWGPDFGFFGHRGKEESKACLKAAIAEWCYIIGVDEDRGNGQHSYVGPWKNTVGPTEEMGRWRHRIAYAFRPFPGWGMWRGRAIRWHNRPKKDPEWEEAVGEMWGEFLRENGQSPDFCPKCGNPMELLGRDCQVKRAEGGGWFVRYQGKWVAKIYAVP